LQDKIYFLGIVDEVTLYSLYKSCAGVVVPTLYEAGSFPLMEALLLGIPVICSDTTSLPDTINDDNFIFNPNDIDSISNKVFQLWNDDTFRSLSSRNGKKQSYKLRNSGALNNLKSVYSELSIK
jgi:glycosyltransferase involved in cell wall biosynthesis